MVLNAKEFLSLKETADMIGIHRVTLQKWIQKDSKTKELMDRLPYGRIGGRFKFLREDVEKFIKDSMNR